ncbi:nuclease [Chitinimonas arctica]|uniref:Nuclease n=2 Tax=Chitinimonas arctica TaxID=2594795 RepID=A0A516SM52_9NEIS|nr:nuclease [Chitinimonas arctica]
MAGLAMPALAAGLPVISQVYGGGGNSGSVWRNDFIELFNRGDAPVTLDGWSVQYASASGSNWQKTSLSGVLQAGQYYLVQQAAGAGGTQNLPNPDAIGALTLSGTAGKVALVNNDTPLPCGSSCALTANVVDFVGFGSANNAEGGAAPAPSNTLSVLRGAVGCSDSNSNSADFSTGMPVPRNRATAPHLCGDDGGPVEPVQARIHDIQGRAHLSPLKGRQVVQVPGVVTALMSNGFFMQDAEPDNDPVTSEGVFVYTGSAPTVQVGDAVQVNGLVTEYRPGGSNAAENLTTTEITAPTVRMISHGNALPVATVIGAAGRQAPGALIHMGHGDVETLGVLVPSVNAIDFYESLEGMRVQVPAPVVVGPSNAAGDMVVLPDNGSATQTRTPRGGVVVAAGDFNPERLTVVKGVATPPQVDVGDRFAAISGILDYGNGDFKLLAGELSGLARGGLSQERTRPQLVNELAIASFNLENLSAGDSAGKFDGLARQIVHNLQSPDIVAVMEVQDNDGAANSGEVDAGRTFARLFQSISQAGGPVYQFRAINPLNGQDGGEPGGNIRQGFLFNPARVAFIDRPGGDAVSAISVQQGSDGPRLSASPGRIEPANPAFSNSRKPLAGEFVFNGRKVFLIANHFNAKTTDQPLFGRFQPPQLGTEPKRMQQTQVVAQFVSRILQADAQAGVVVLGDMNDFEFSPALGILKAAGLRDLVENLPPGERYTYVYEGNSQALDHILVSAGLASRTEYDVVHVNSEFANQTSDHEPEVARISLPPLVDGSANFTWQASGLSYNRATGIYQGTVTLTATNAMAGPLALALADLPAGVSLANGNATVANLPAIRLPGSVTAGQRLTVTLQFRNPGNVRLGYAVRVYSGL